MELFWGIVTIICLAFLFRKQGQSKGIEYPTNNQNNFKPRRESARPELKSFIEGKDSDYIVFDTETNGVNPENCSVLSISAIRFYLANDGIRELARFNRFYYPVEPFNPEAVAVNGLTKEVITEMRTSEYASNFRDDPDFKEFCKGANRFIGHNISFDAGFVPFVKLHKKFDTMKTNCDIVCSAWNEKYNEWKWPKLKETASYYNININESDLHGSMYDTELTLAIFEKMLWKANILGALGYTNS